jgi:signal transduction histidine kinase
MLELVVGGVAVLFVLLGAAIIAGPALPRAWRAALLLARRRPRPATASAAVTSAAAGRGAPDLHPTTMKALTAAARTYSLLRANGEDRVAGELRAAARRVRTDEAQGLLALAAVLRGLREVSLEDGDAEERYRRLVSDLKGAVKDRSEQLELLHFG